MASIKNTRTEKNVLTAFAGESQARNRYTFFASVAKKEGYEQISAIFTETANQEKEHAERLFKYLEGGGVSLNADATFPAGVIGSTLENLKAAAAGENYETNTMYPEFADVADEEGFVEIAAVMRHIAVAEQHHEDRYLALAANIEKNQVFKRSSSETIWACRNCGYIHHGANAPEKCPACDHAKAYFEIYNENY